MMAMKWQETWISSIKLCRSNFVCFFACFVLEHLLVVVWQEFAGLGGDVGFFKNEVEAQANLPLWTTTDQATGETFSDIVLQVITRLTSLVLVISCKKYVLWCKWPCLVRYSGDLNHSFHKFYSSWPLAHKNSYFTWPLYQVNTKMIYPPTCDIILERPSDRKAN